MIAVQTEGAKSPAWMRLVDKVHIEGNAAYHEGACLDDNPYEGRDDELASVWEEGWRSAAFFWGSRDN